ncbi:hypothetical protein HOY34_20040 [Xinfangfangia sp. D13-10-4-6]|uniref:hypothetical protein n=1 Tax=Pseudogemmobacter hezensis TaxID=2737662 RepID=UPI00155637A2|nr:hypothetical protein [Pseudogemmobacter hezensis]NPD17480.1 hypothetical protein [Pseudogemmobacter hezensis]
MNSLKRIFAGVDTRYILRAYLIGAILLAIVVGGFLSRTDNVGRAAAVLGYFTLCTLLFPFAKLVWDQLKSLVLGETVLFLPIVFLYPAKMIVNVLLWGAAVFVAPFGIAYIWFNTREQ